MTYNGKPIEALFHSSSGGMTEDAANVFGGDAPYLKSVSSPGEEGFSRYSATVSFTRKQFANAVAACKRKGAILLVAKLDRLARCCSVLEAIQSAGVAFRVAEMPEANELTLGLLMVIARNEREMCAARTKAALAEKKAQGVKLGAAREGAYKFTAATAAESRAKHTEKARENKANRHAWNFAAPFLGDKSLREIARLLNAEGYNTPRGGQWTAQQVSNLAKLMGA